MHSRRWIAALAAVTLGSPSVLAAQGGDPTATTGAGEGRGEIRLLVTIGGRAAAPSPLPCSIPNETNPDRGYYCGNIDHVRSAISRDGIHFDLEAPEWLTYGDMADPAWGVRADGTWQLFASTFGGPGHEGLLRYTEQAGCPYFPGNGGRGAPYERDFRLVQVGGRPFAGGVPDLARVGGETRLYYAGVGGIHLAHLVAGEVVPDAHNPILRPADFHDPGLVAISDPTVTRRADGTFVMFLKGLPPPGGDPHPTSHRLLRATSRDGVGNWRAEAQPLVVGGSVPGAVTDRRGRVAVYFLYFGPSWSPDPYSPEQKERPYVMFERRDGTMTRPRPVVFRPPQDQVDPGFPLSFYNDPDPVLNPRPGDPGYCPAAIVAPPS